MKNKFNPNFAEVIEKMFAIANMIHEIRNGFHFTKNDNYAKDQEKFIKHWRELEKKQKRKKEK